jgi:hypothetical protein
MSDVKNFVIEVLLENPKDKIVWNLGQECFTSEKMIELIKSDDEIGKRFTTELFRVSRDLIARKSK